MVNVKPVVVGVGHYLPKTIVHNCDLPEILQTSHEWIVERTGITQRHVANDEETTAYMGYEAARQALQNAQLKSTDVDAVIVATTTPDHGFPAVATRVQALLGMTHGFGFDVQAVCSGFIYALSVADSLITTGKAKTVVLIGAESMTRIVDWTDRSTCILFGDGAGAFVLRAEESVNPQARGILSTHLYSDGCGYDLLYVNHGTQTAKNRGAIKMQGREIFKSAVNKIGEAVQIALTANKLTMDDIACFVPHQANARIIQGVIDLFNLPPQKVIVTIDKHANTSAASIPLAFYEAMVCGKIKTDDFVMMEAMGGGLTWGSALLKM